jgi:uncharacterized protein YjiS (DUF1127 family)
MGMRLLPANAPDGPMSAIANHSAPFSASGTVDKRFFTGICRHLLDAILGWRVRMLQRSELMMLNGAELRELSLNEADVNRETRKPFWESIEINGR